MFLLGGEDYTLLLAWRGCGSHIVASPMFHFDKADGSSATGNKINLASMAFPPLGENPVKADKQPDNHKGLYYPASWLGTAALIDRGMPGFMLRGLSPPTDQSSVPVLLLATASAIR